MPKNKMYGKPGSSIKRAGKKGKGKRGKMGAMKTMRKMKAC